MPCLSHCMNVGGSRAKQEFCRDGTDIPARFPGWSIYPCEVFRLGQVLLRSFEDRMNISPWFPGWACYLYEVFMIGKVYPRGFRVGTYSCEFYCEVWTGQIFLYVSQDGADSPARCIGWDVSTRFPHLDRSYCEVPRMRQIFVRGSQDRTEDLECSQDTSRCMLKGWGISFCEVRE